MSEVIYKGPAKKETSIHGYAGLWGLAMACGMYIGVVWFIGEKAPDGMTASLPYVSGTALLFLVWGIYKYTRSDSYLEIMRTGENKYSFYLTSPNKQVVAQFGSPFTVSYGWQRDNSPKMGHMKHLYLGFFDQNGKNLLTLKNVVGTIHSAPAGWPELTNQTVAVYLDQFTYVSNGWQKIVDHFIYKK